ncbi:MAG TPA: condensation domain-containing protein, partial [Vicinamibacteria bacterium]|nr:condensation domain-containing protein [Vicinamibacteria bacterium]
TASLQDLARRSRLTLNTLVQGAWALALGHGCNGDDVVFGATLSGRPATLAGAESILGPFINTLPVRVRIDDAAGVGAWLAALQEAQLELRAYEFSPLVHVQRWSDVPPGRRLFDSLLVFQNVPAAEGGPGLEVDDVVVRDGATSFPLSLDVRPGEELLILASHDPERLGAVAVERLLDGLETSLAAFAAAPSVGAVRDRLREADQRRQARADEELAVSSRERLRHAVRRTVRVAAEER